MGKVIMFPRRPLVAEEACVPKALPCGEIFKCCNFVARGASDDEVIVRAVQHGQLEHSMNEIDWRTLAGLCAAIREDIPKSICN